jgi:hypothetical protein
MLYKDGKILGAVKEARSTCEGLKFPGARRTDSLFLGYSDGPPDK